MNQPVDTDDGYRSVGGIRGLYADIAALVTKWLFPVGLLAGRIYIGWTFFKTGLSRLETVLDGKWANEVFLFEHEHPIPGIPPEIAAPATMVAELVLPVLVVLGVFGRLGAAGLLLMACVIQFVIGAANDNYNLPIHYVWIVVLAVLTLRGPGWLSLDHLLLRTEKH